MKRKRLKKAAAWILTAAMITTIVPVTNHPVQAEETQAEENTSTAKTIAGLGAAGITDPLNPNEDTSVTDWTGSYVYYGKYDGNPVKYRVLDAETKDYSADGTTKTMLLDCDNVLYQQAFDADGTANADDKMANDWSVSDVKNSLNGTGFLNKDGVFTAVEKSAIAESTVAAHALQTSDEEGVTVPVASWTQSTFKNYVPLAGEKIFLLDAEDVSNGAYGYSMTESSCDNRRKMGKGSLTVYWWLRSASVSSEVLAGCVPDDGYIQDGYVGFHEPGVSPALNLNLSSVLFSSVIKGTAGENGAEYKLTLLDEDMTVKPEKGVVRKGDTVTIPYSISGNNSGSATQISVLILDKEYTKGNTNQAKVLAYEKIADVSADSESGTGTLELPDALLGKNAVTKYYAYLIAEDVNGEKETDYASKPAACSLWEAPEVQQMNFGTEGIVDPAVPDRTDNDWKGSYVYYGNYDANGDGTAEPVKYRVLDTKTTDYSEPDEDNKKAETMLLDCDDFLYYTPFDADGEANADGKNANDWSVSDVKNSLNGDDFLNKDGVFTTAEKSAIAESKKTAVNEKDGVGRNTLDFASLAGEQIFLLDAKEATSGAYGYSNTDDDAKNRMKTGSTKVFWWLRSAYRSICSGYVRDSDGDIRDRLVENTSAGVSPALNLNLSSVLFSSAGTEETAFAGKSSSLTSESTKIGTTTNTAWKLTLLDKDKTVALTKDRNATKAGDGTITVPYTYTDKEGATEREQVNQISVMITDKEYKAGNTDGAEILYYGALDNIKDAEDQDSTVAEETTGTGTFALPSGLTGKTQGTDYHVYLLAEHVNADNSTDYASAPVEVKILNEADTIILPDMSAYVPIAEQALKTEISITSEGTSGSAVLTWKKNNNNVTGDAEWKTTYQMYVTLTAEEGYTFTDAKGNKAAITLKENPVDEKDITWDNDGTVTVYCGEYTTATRTTQKVTAPEVPAQFTAYYTADKVLSSTELGTKAAVTLEGSTEPNPQEMDVEWSIVGAVDAGGICINAEYDATPGALNVFQWTVKPSEYAEYDGNGVVMTGTVTIRNKDYTPVTISGEDVTMTWDGRDTLDVSEYFTMDKNAGTPTYELANPSTGASVGIGTLTGTTLAMTTLGTFTIKCSTDINGVYGTGMHTLTITVKKAVPELEKLPTVADRTYYPAKVLADNDMTGGQVKGVTGDTLSGTWSWKRADIVPVGGNDGYVAVFMPADTVHYETVERTLAVKVLKATPYVWTIPTASAITYGESLSASKLSDGAMRYSEKDNTAIEGTFTWKDAAAKPTVADSGKTEYIVVFTPAEKENYNVVEMQLTITVNKSLETPNQPEAVLRTAYENDTVGKVALPEDWVWENTDTAKALTVEQAVTATAVYNGADKGNYVTESVEIAITRESQETGSATVSDDGKASYTVTSPDSENRTDQSDNTGTAERTVAYTAPTNQKQTAVTIPDTVTIDGVTYKVTAIKKNAFKNDKKLTKITIGSNILTIGDNAFYGCKKLKTVKGGKNVTVIGNKAFYNCSTLTKLTIPAKVKKIGKQAFYGCTKLKAVTVKTQKLTAKNVGSKAFAKTPKKLTVKVPKKKFKAYKKLLVKKGISRKVKFRKK